MKSVRGTFVFLFIIAGVAATIIPFALEGCPNCKCFCSKIPPLKDLLCRKLCGPCSLLSMLKSSVPTIRPCPLCGTQKHWPSTCSVPSCAPCMSSCAPCMSPCAQSCSPCAYCPPCAPSIPFGPSIPSYPCGSEVPWWK